MQQQVQYGFNYGQSSVLNQQFIKKLNRLITSKNVQSFYKWSPKHNQWIRVQNNFNKNQTKSQALKTIKSLINIGKQSITSITLNVLFDYRGDSTEPDKDRGHMKYSKQRYQNIIEQLQKYDVDVVTLNEVTKQFIRMLQLNQWIRKNYKISTNVKEFTNGFGNILLTKLNPFLLHSYKVPGLPRPVIIAFFMLNDNKNKNKNEQNIKLISFSSMHLIAYDVNSAKRQKQLTSIKNYLDQFKQVVDQHILQGDMNLHSQKENINFKNNNLDDCWFIVNKIQKQQDLQKFPGYTFDSQVNRFIKELYWGFEKRRMRLDRIFISKYKKPVLKPIQMKVVFNQPIFGEPQGTIRSNIFKSVFSFVGDKLGYNVFRNKQEYLFCSDHFGLWAKFVLC